MKEFIILLGIIFLCLFILRAILGNYGVIKSPNYNMYAKIWNVIETILIAYATTILIINYY